MEPIIWTDSFSVGVAELDQQHQRLIKMLNRVIEARGTVSTHSETISEVLADMTRYAEEHFRAEEVLMGRYIYPALPVHREQHIAFQEKTADMCVAATFGEDTVPETLLTFLSDWLVHHIQHEDMKYKPFFASKGVT